MEPSSNPTMTVVGLAVIMFWLLFIGTTIWVGVDARKRDWSSDRFASNAVQWVIGMLVLWIVVFPVYLVKRRRVPSRSIVVYPARAVAGSMGRIPPPPAGVSGPAADWYPDPYGHSRLRYWDGTQWTQSTSR